MDDNIGNILYIIITVVVLALGLFGKKKKGPSKGNASSGEASSEPGFLENLERALNDLGRDEAEVVDLKRDEPDLAAEEMEPELAKEEADYDPFREYLARKEREANARSASYEELTHREANMGSQMDLTEEGSGEKQIEVVDLDQDEGIDYFDVVRNFNLGTAVVYSAIINRLDY